MSLRNRTIFRGLLFFLGLLLLNFLASFFYQRFDLTSENRFTLSEPTKEMISDLEDIVYVDVFLEGQLPAGFRRLRNSTQEMLNELQLYSRGNVQYRFQDVSEEEDLENLKAIYQELANKGLSPTTLQENTKDGRSERIIIPGAIISYRGRETAVPLLISKAGMNNNEVLTNSVSLLEYSLSSGIKRVLSTKSTSIGFMRGQGELEAPDIQSIINTLSKTYDVESFNMKDILCIPEKYDVIIVAKPTESYIESDKYAIDQYVMKGGKILWFLDAMIAELDSLGADQTFMSVDRPLNLDDMLFKYGVRINKNLVQDLQSSPIPVVTGSLGDAAQTSLYEWWYYPVITSQKNDHPIVKNLDAVMTRFASTIDTIVTKKVKKTVLLSTSDYTKVLYSPIRVNLSMLKTEPNRDQFNKQNQPIAVLLEGKFSSVFKNRLPGRTTAMIDTIDCFEKKDLSESTKMIVVADGDMIRNDISTKTGNNVPLGFNRFNSYTFANEAFILNSIEYLTDRNGLIDTRTKEIKVRPLNYNKIKDEKFRWQIINLLFPILLVVFFGFLFSFLRKRKYAA